VLTSEGGLAHQGVTPKLTSPQQLPSTEDMARHYVKEEDARRRASAAIRKLERKADKSVVKCLKCNGWGTRIRT
jgi:hypothetical protein